MENSLCDKKNSLCDKINTLFDPIIAEVNKKISFDIRSKMLDPFRMPTIQIRFHVSYQLTNPIQDQNVIK